MLPIRKILCPTDFSEPSFKGVAAADELAAHFGAELVLVTAVVPISFSIENEIPTEHLAADLHRQMVNNATASLKKLIAERITAGVRAKPFVVQGSAADEITALAKNEGVDLLVIATHGWTGWRRFIFGSVAEKVIRLATCPVLTITGTPAD